MWLLAILETTLQLMGSAVELVRKRSLEEGKLAIAVRDTWRMKQEKEQLPSPYILFLFIRPQKEPCKIGPILSVL